MFHGSNMKHLYVLICFILVGCSTVPRPDLGLVKQGTKKYEHYQTTVLGKPVGKPKLRVVPGKMDKTQEVLRKPAKWSLYGALPAAFLAGAICLVAVIYLQNTKLAKLCAVASGALFLVALFAAAWLIATTWMWAFVPLIALLIGIVVWIAYIVTKGKRPRVSLSSG